MAGEILVIGEIANGKIKNATFECITKARELSEKNNSDISLLLLGKCPNGLLPDTYGFSIKKVYLIENEGLEKYIAENFSNFICNQIRKVSPDLILLPSTLKGKDLAPRIAANLGTGLASDCIDIKQSDDGTTVFTRPVFAGKLIARLVFLEKIFQIAALRPKIVQIEKKEAPPPEIFKIDSEPLPLISKKRVREIRAKESTRLDIQEADIVVSGGRGIGSAENFKVLEELAEILGGAVGASRAAVDAGWRDHSCQVGQTGKTIVPKLNIACGISGSMQHLAGISSSRCIVAINKDPEAPIFKKADYGIVGDLFKIVPLLTKELRNLL